MVVILQVLEITAPAFLLAVVGWAWVRRGIAYDIAFVTRLAIEIGMPCLLIVTLSRVEIAPEAFRSLAVGTLLLYGAMAAVGWLAVRFSGGAQRVYLSPFTFGNTGNLGLPLALFAFGETGLAYAMVVFAIMIVINFTVGIWIVSGEGRPTEALKQPMVYATLIGSALAYYHIALPEWLFNTLDLTGRIAIPLMLITLGVAVAKLAGRPPWRATMLSVVKAVLSLVLGFGLAHWLGLTGEARGAFVIQALTPVAVTSYLLAEKFDAEPEQVAAFVVASTLLSILVLPAALSVLL